MSKARDRRRGEGLGVLHAVVTIHAAANQARRDAARPRGSAPQLADFADGGARRVLDVASDILSEGLIAVSDGKDVHKTKTKNLGVAFRVAIPRSKTESKRPRRPP